MGWLSHAVSGLSWIKGAIERDTERKAAAPNVADYLVALISVFFILALVLGSIAAGWLLMWRTTLHKIGVFRELMGLNRAQKLAAKQKAKVEIQRLKSQFSRGAVDVASTALDKQH